MTRKRTLAERYPPSAACACPTCLAFCSRPGWWTVAEAARAITAGYAGRMMLELAPERTFAVLSPAFKGCEGFFATQENSRRGCNFLDGENRCQLHGTGYQPLECRFCHHERAGLGPKCHADLEKDWHTPAGQALVESWVRQVGLWEQYRVYRIEK